MELSLVNTTRVIPDAIVVDGISGSFGVVPSTDVDPVDTVVASLRVCTRSDLRAFAQALATRVSTSIGG